MIHPYPSSEEGPRMRVAQNCSSLFYANTLGCHISRERDFHLFQCRTPTNQFWLPCFVRGFDGPTDCKYRRPVLRRVDLRPAPDSFELFGLRSGTALVESAANEP